MGRFVNLVGKRYGRLVVKEEVGRNKWGSSCWRCECDCGALVVVMVGHLNSGHTRSCGCLHKDVLIKNLTTHGQACASDRSKVYRVWVHIKGRTRNSNNSAYRYYGARGVGMCDEWYDSFPVFYTYVGDPPGPEYTIERIDNNKGYEPGNVKWATREEQANNTRRNVFIEWRGETLTLSQWARKLKINMTTLHSRIFKLGWSVDRAFLACRCR